MVSFAICFFLLGYFRYAVFLNINERASLLLYKSNYPPLPGFLSMLETYNYAGLLNVKWALTTLFIVVYAFASAFTLKTVFNNLKYAYIGLGFYVGVFLIAVLFMGMGMLIPSFYKHGYNISRSFLHFAQSPVITIFLLVAIYGYKRPQ